MPILATIASRTGLAQGWRAEPQPLRSLEISGAMAW